MGSFSKYSLIAFFGLPVLFTRIQNIGVSIVPGQTALTRILCGANLSASALTMLDIAPFVA